MIKQNINVVISRLENLEHFCQKGRHRLIQLKGVQQVVTLTPEQISGIIISINSFFSDLEAEYNSLVESVESTESIAE